MENTVVLVTGPLGNLGSAVVKRFLAPDTSLFLLDRHPDRLLQSYPELAASPSHLLLPGVDLLDKKGVEQALERGIAKFNHIDSLIHTVGGFTMGETVAELEDQTWQRMMDLNLRTLLNTARPVITQMLEQKKGKIITIGARPALEGRARMSAYSAAKAGVLRLTEALSAEVKSKGINANCVIPGTIDTPENRKAMPDADTSRWVSPDSVAEVIHFLCSPAADDIHGAAVPIYGA